MPDPRANRRLSPALPVTGGRGSQEARSQQQSVTPAAAVPGRESSSPSPALPSPLQSAESVATELEDRCPICLDSMKEVSFVMPCLHRFCYPCILRWAESKPECPLCKRTTVSILHSVRSDDKFEEHLVTPPAAASVVVQQAGGAPGHAAAEQVAREHQLPTAAPGGLQPSTWAFLFREHPSLIQSLRPWVWRELVLILGSRLWQAAAAENLLVSTLGDFGLDEEILVSQLQLYLQNGTAAFVHHFIAVAVQRCSREARLLLGLDDGSDAAEQEGSPGTATVAAESPRPSPASSPALREGPGSHRSSPVPTRGAEGETQGDPEEAVPGPSSPSRGSERRAGGPRRAPKRKNSSPEPTSPPDKRPPRRQQ